MEKKQGFKVFLKDLKEDKLSNILVFFGEEKYLIDWAVKEIINKYIDSNTRDMDFEKIDITESDFSRIEASYYTSPFFSKKRVIILENYKGEFIENIRNLEIGEDENFLLIVTNLSNASTLLESFNSYEFLPLDRKDILSFIEKRLKLANISVDRSVTSLVAKESGYFDKDRDYNLYNLEGELNKIIAYIKSSHESLKIEKIKEILTDTLENNVFRMIDAISMKRKDIALEKLKELVQSGINPQVILSNIINHCEAMIQVKELMITGMVSDDIARNTKIHSFRVSKIMTNIRNYDITTIKEILLRAYNTEAIIKMGSIQADFALELLVGNI